MTHKSEDYKISAVKYYLNNKDNLYEFIISLSATSVLCFPSICIRS